MRSLTGYQKLRTVRPRSGGVPVLLCVLMFAMTAMIVNRLGRERWNPVDCQPTYTATAFTLDKQSGVATPFVFTDADPRRAADAADQLAERHVADQTTQWQRNVEQRQAKTGELTEKARQDYRESLARLEAFQRQQREAAQAKLAHRPKPEPTMIENPRWTETQARVSDLERRRERLLQDRTPLHPAVQEITDRLTQTQKELAAIPRQIPGKSVETPDTDSQPVIVAPQIDPLVAKKERQKLDQLTAAVERSRAACEKAKNVQKQAAEQRNAEPQLLVQNAKSVRNERPVDYGWRRLLWTTFAAGLLMAFGVGSVAAGTKIEPPIASVDEVESALGKSVIGTLPADNPGLDKTSIHRQAQARFALILLGLLVIVACPIVAVWGVMGI
jgi:hypothetical protein